MKRPELMSPVSDWVSLRAAIEGGCDAVYLGVKDLNMRITAKNFELNELKKLVTFCHENKVRAYLTINTIIYEKELKNLKRVLDEAKKAEVDAIICWDFSVIQESMKRDIDIILSTQASVSNSESAKFFEKLGIKRVVLARECTLEQIKEIKEKTNLEIEIFIHGAMCVSESGRCFISQFLFNKSANRGNCLQPCRRGYIVKDPEEGHELKLENNYVMSPKDLCSIRFIDKIIETGIDSLKIEGRARSPEYVKLVTKVYRKAIDAYFEGKLNENMKKEFEEELRTVFNRDFSKGFMFGKPINEWTKDYGSSATKKKVYLGKVKNWYQKIGVAEIKLRSGDLKVGDKMMIQGKTTGVYEQRVDSMEINHEKKDVGLKGQAIAIKIEGTVRVNDKVFRIEES